MYRNSRFFISLGLSPAVLGTALIALASVPLLVSFTHGDGKVAFSTFRVAKNADSDIVLMLQYMMYSL